MGWGEPTQAAARVSWPWPRDDVRHLAAQARFAARVQGRPIDQQLVVAWSYGRTLLTEINARDAAEGGWRATSTAERNRNLALTASRRSPEIILSKPVFEIKSRLEDIFIYVPN